MIKAKELRIGNFVNIVSAPSPYHEELGIMECVGYTIYLLSTEEDIKAEGIPLTEEWLLKFGFEKKDRFGDYATYIAYTKGEISVNNKWGIYLRNNQIRHIDYIHELQNLCHALTGKELTIKP